VTSTALVTWKRGRGASGIVWGLVLSVAACARSANSVEAPMIAAGASTSGPVLAGNRIAPPTADRADLPFKPGDRWTGTYLCRQGESDMAIVFADVRSDGSSHDEENVDVDAVFEFRFDGNGKVGYAAAAGTARMRGKYDVKARRLRLKGEEWIDQPPNYALINLVGTVNATTRTYSGTVEGPGCTSFSAGAEDASGDLRP
jgi:hypothetical protein